MSELIPLVPSDRPEMPLGVRRSSSSVKLTNDAPVTLSVLTVTLLGFSEVASLWGGWWMLVLYVLEQYTAGYSLCRQSRLLFV